jgi:outer membrane protein assembly factor BamB
VKWAQRMEDWPENADQDGSDFWNLACPDHVAGCPTPEGPDYDFGSAPNLITYAGSKTILGAGQKSGLYYAFNPETGELLWQTQVGPGSSLSGIMWGSATDGERIYVPISDVAGIRYAGGTAGSWAALDPANGKILWQVPDPYGAWGIGPVAVANGVVYVPSTAGKATDRNMIALNAANERHAVEFRFRGHDDCRSIGTGRGGLLGHRLHAYSSTGVHGRGRCVLRLLNQWKSSRRNCGGKIAALDRAFWIDSYRC